MEYNDRLFNLFVNSLRDEINNYFLTKRRYKIEEKIKNKLRFVYEDKEYKLDELDEFIIGKKDFKETDEQVRKYEKFYVFREQNFLIVDEDYNLQVTNQHPELVQDYDHGKFGLLDECKFDKYWSSFLFDMMILYDNRKHNGYFYDNLKTYLKDNFEIEIVNINKLGENVNANCKGK